MGNPSYILILSGILLSAYALHMYFHLHVFRTTSHMFAYIFTILLLSTIWDYFSVWENIWAFPAGGTIGLRIGILPIEEFLFFLIVPYFGLTIYKVFEKRFDK